MNILNDYIRRRYDFQRLTRTEEDAINTYFAWRVAMEGPRGLCLDDTSRVAIARILVQKRMALDTVRIRALQTLLDISDADREAVLHLVAAHVREVWAQGQYSPCTTEHLATLMDMLPHRFPERAMALGILTQREEVSREIQERNAVRHNRENPVPVVPTNRIKKVQRTIYEDGQNVHTTSINEHMKASLQLLHEQWNAEKNVVQYEELLLLLSLGKAVSSKAMRSIFYIMTSDAKLVGCSMMTTAECLVRFAETLDAERKKEFSLRLHQELEEMQGQCATGHFTRLVNATAGFWSSNAKMDTKEEMMASMAHYVKGLASSNEPLMDLLVEGDMHSVFNWVKPHLTKLRSEWSREYGYEVSEKDTELALKRYLHLVK